MKDKEKLKEAYKAIDFFLDWAGGFEGVQKKTFVQFDVWQQLDIIRNPKKYKENDL